MISWSAAEVASAGGASLVAGFAESGPSRAAIDTRAIASGDLFFGLVGERVDGGRFAADALAAGAWGVVVTPSHAAGLAGGVVLVADDPLLALQRLATAWRRALDAAVIGVTGSVGKTSTKQLIAALVAPHRRVAANPANFNTEIGLPLAVLAAPPDTEVLVLEMGMRGFGQIDELARIAEPDVGVITNVGPVHLELVGSLEGVARAKAELLAHVPVAVVPADEPLLSPYLRDDLDVVRFGTDVMLEDFDPPRVSILARELRVELTVPFTARHQLVNLLAAVAAAQAVGVEPSGAVDVEFGALRGEHIALPSGVVIINDCYNANPLSMRAALDDLATQAPAGGRRVAVLGDMLELGAGEAEEHRAVGAYAASSGVDVLVAVGPLSSVMPASFGGESYVAADATSAASVVAGLVAPGDVVLVKASRGIGLETVAEALARG
ncbi:UDP-N-acetylmuramoyl-tripeptide--D-alanyl-D-alanine ligase [Solirubrobacter ginsenosidimutans]|uniref:UDP-N-acetylmuramoyl-tripeptide--D-alanyl-D-alanine ligase n=1 Tax=Solirubrobacter ginsenosidimutans TaxID=490573 RepID=A0A9X3S3P6_9ACTN|nr:UDP-N-acetylmuramoyl-tripeptide--D-alanyl-D-alanine ligase [Solirubrobacter ginsenosidimutans]MDA0164849.1 UDP-N-acetylmuramoyl-tripeptide--D-alanyl-D-alanine ligase [Solirubrobacter ginsenosidimutans]